MSLSASKNVTCATSILPNREILKINKEKIMCNVLMCLSIEWKLQPFQLRLPPSKAEKSNTNAKSLLGVTIKNPQIEQNLVSRDK